MTAITPRVLFQQQLHGYVLRGWSDGRFDVVDDWWLPAAATFDTYEAARAWIERAGENDRIVAAYYPGRDSLHINGEES